MDFRCLGGQNSLDAVEYCNDSIEISMANSALSIYKISEFYLQLRVFYLTWGGCHAKNHLFMERNTGFNTKISFLIEKSCFLYRNILFLLETYNFWLIIRNLGDNARNLFKILRLLRSYSRFLQNNLDIFAENQRFQVVN